MYCKLTNIKRVIHNVHCINSSKVYCKSEDIVFIKNSNVGINSSKVYCKFIIAIIYNVLINVLIVAKCIVNTDNK